MPMVPFALPMVPLVTLPMVPLGEPRTEPKSFNADAISSLHLLKSIWEGNLYLATLERILRILESGMIFKFSMTTRPAHR